MATVQIDSPTNGGAVTAGTAFTVQVEWDASIGVRKAPARKRGTPPTAAQYTVRCTGGTDVPTDDTTGTCVFSVTAGAAGTSMTITASLWENDSGGTPANPLASDSVTVAVLAAGAFPGSLGGLSPPPPVPPPPAARGSVRTTPAVKYVCGTYKAPTANLVVVTYQVEVDKTVPRDGKPGSPSFTVSKRLRKVKQYSVYGRNLSMAGGKWQATVPASICKPTDAYQIQAWFLNAGWEVLTTLSAALAPIARDTPCA